MNALRQWWGRISAREQRWFLTLGFFVLCFWGYQAFYRPQVARLKKIRVENATLRHQIRSIQESLPDLAREREDLKRRTRETEGLKLELEGTERQMLTVGGLSIFLKELSRQAEGLGITFEAIKQEVNEDPDQPQLGVEMSFLTTYEGLVNYARRIESMSPFLRAQRMEIARPKDRAGIQAQIVWTAPLLLSTETGAWDSASLPPGQKFSLTQTPFGSGQNSQESSQYNALNVTGIVWQPGKSTAIINGDVYREGDRIDQLLVEQILPDQVIISDGTRSQALRLESRELEQGGRSSRSP